MWRPFWIPCVFVLVFLTTTAAQSAQDQALSEESATPAPLDVAEVVQGREAGASQQADSRQGVMRAVELARDIAVIVASLVAILGVSAWKREFKGKRDMELAENVLESFYRAERAIEAIRFPIWNLADGQARSPEPDETPEEKKARDRAYIVIKRIKEHSDIFNQLYTLRFRFMARFGRHRAKPFDEMKRVVDTIMVCTRRLAEFWAEQLRDGERTHPSIKEEIKEYERIISYAGAKDPTESRVSGIIAEIEGICRPVIEGGDSRFLRLWRKAFARKETVQS